MKKVYRQFLVAIINYQLLLGPNAAFAKSSQEATVGTYNLQELALPSEVTKLNKKSGAIFYSPSVKGKVLVPIHFWGKVANAGLHFMPIETTLIQGLSMAGGPVGTARMDNIKLTRKVNNKLTYQYFDLTTGGDTVAYQMELKPGDMIFVEESNYFENRSYYTSLVGVIATILSSILLYRQVKKN